MKYADPRIRHDTPFDLFLKQSGGELQYNSHHLACAGFLCGFESRA